VCHWIYLYSLSGTIAAKVLALYHRITHFADLLSAELICKTGNNSSLITLKHEIILGRLPEVDEALFTFGLHLLLL